VANRKARASASAQEADRRGKWDYTLQRRVVPGLEGVDGLRLQLPDEWTAEPVDPICHQWANYRAWRSTVLFLIDQIDKGEETDEDSIRSAWEAAEVAGEVWRPYATVEPFAHRAGLDCVCWGCLYDKLEGL